MGLQPEERKEAIYKERIKCATDYKYLIETYFTVDAGGDTKNFILYPHQIDSLNCYLTYQNNITMKTRQMGFTTFTAAFIASELINNSNFKTLIISRTSKEAIDFVKKTKDILNNARKLTKISNKKGSKSWLIPEYLDGYNNKTEFHLTNGSLCSSQGNTEDSGRGFAGLNLAVVDEVAFIDRKSTNRMNEIWAALGPALSTVNGKSIMISCVTKDTYIFTDKGLIQVIDLAKDEFSDSKSYKIPKYNVLGHDGFREGCYFKNNGIGTTYKLTTCYSELKAHENHKVWAYSGGKYGIFKASELKEGDFLNVKKGMNVYGNNNDISDFKPYKTTNGLVNVYDPKVLNEDIAYFLGLYISKGRVSVEEEYLEITFGDSELAKVLNNMGLRWSKIDNSNYRIFSKNLVEFILYLGFKQEDSELKEIPKRILGCSKNIIISLLQGIFDGTANVGVKEGYVKISLESKSETLLTQIRMLLGNIGIFSSLREIQETYSKENSVIINSEFDYSKCCTQVIELSNFFSLVFMKEVGFRLERKKKIKGLFVENEETFKIPNSSELINILKGEGYTPYILKNKYGLKIDKGVIDSSDLKSVLNLIKNKDVKIESEEDYYFDDSSYWLPINKITKNEERTYDVSLPEIEGDKWCHSVIHSMVMSFNTPFGSQGWYYDTYMNAETMGFNIINAHWVMHPIFNKGMYQWIKDPKKKAGGYIKFLNKTWPDKLQNFHTKQMEEIPKTKYPFVCDGKIRSPWYDYESRKLGAAKTARELDCTFVGTGGEVLSSEVLQIIDSSSRLNTFKKIYKRGLLSNYREYKAPKSGNNYILSSDMMTGDGKDYSTVVILDLYDLTICGTIKIQAHPKYFSEVISVLAKRFNNAVICVENQGGGATALQELKEKNIPNIYYTVLNQKDETIGMRKRKIGFWQSENTRIKGGDKLEYLLLEGELIIPCFNLASEFHTWVWSKQGRREHAPGKNDDLIMALQNAVYYWNYVYKRNKRRSQNFKKIFSIQSDTFYDDEYDKMMSFSDLEDKKEKISPDLVEYDINGKTKGIAITRSPMESIKKTKKFF